MRRIRGVQLRLGVPLREHCLVVVASDDQVGVLRHGDWRLHELQVLVDHAADELKDGLLEVMQLYESQNQLEQHQDGRLAVQDVFDREITHAQGEARSQSLGKLGMANERQQEVKVKRLYLEALLLEDREKGVQNDLDRDLLVLAKH